MDTSAVFQQLTSNNFMLGMHDSSMGNPVKNPILGLGIFILSQEYIFHSTDENEDEAWTNTGLKPFILSAMWIIGSSLV
ncbi:uncharacterized protein BBOV_IV004195 [Babesia bovis T2Bo]|uniref:uncharacterized protein n=1 Tax=Babesia bovis T2Bo TaxID=484906 RepID=UPI001DD41FFC|nr:uncharacterized protein BBOV_IV004195 [Babesia bovis T2Bo]KAG6439958.1 hypothetical protein BBOV_IV004195 [Babesia bovis T2Bo]